MDWESANSGKGTRGERRSNKLAQNSELRTQNSHRTSTTQITNKDLPATSSQNISKITNCYQDTISFFATLSSLMSSFSPFILLTVFFIQYQVAAKAFIPSFKIPRKHVNPINSVAIRGGGEDPEICDDVKDIHHERRWNGYLSANGSWSGSVGYCDLAKNEIMDGSSTRNMKMSFQPRDTDPDVFDWKVRDATANGSEQNLVIYKNAREDPNFLSPRQKQRKYFFFEDNMIGYSGVDFQKAAYVEVGFFDRDDGMRRSVVLMYDRDTGDLGKVWFIQQKEKEDRGFDLSSTYPDDISIMSKSPTLSLEQLWSRWVTAVEEQGKSEIQEISSDTYRRYEGDGEDISCVLKQLLQGDTHSMKENKQVSLPNGVVLSCPLSIKREEHEKRGLRIMMGHERECGRIQTVELEYDEELKLSTVKSCYGIMK